MKNLGTVDIEILEELLEAEGNGDFDELYPIEYFLNGSREDKIM